MNKNVEPLMRGEFAFYDRKPAAADMLAEVTAGLGRELKALPPKYFYDEEGSALFEAITELPEYYLTRTELELFDVLCPTLAETIGAADCVVEYGSGSSRKIRKLLDSAKPQAYVPVDISGDHLQASALKLHSDCGWLDVYPTCADYTQVFQLPEPVHPLAKLGFFPGSSIGNFEPEHAVGFLRNVLKTLGPDAKLLVGVDRKKPRHLLEAAYNDAEGVTARFNRNVLVHLNEALGADFDAGKFVHEASYDAGAGCVNMFLRSLVRQTVHIGDRQFQFDSGELLHTESSFKYHPEEFERLAHRAGFRQQAIWTDEQDWFAVFLLEASA